MLKLILTKIFNAVEVLFIHSSCLLIETCMPEIRCNL